MIEKLFKAYLFGKRTNLTSPNEQKRIQLRKKRKRKSK